MSDFIVSIAIGVVATVLAITLHEAAHGYAAVRVDMRGSVSPTGRIGPKASTSRPRRPRSLCTLNKCTQHKEQRYDLPF